MEVNTIMRDSSTIMRDRQRTIRRQLDTRGITLKAVSFDSGIPYSTLCSYFPGNEHGPTEKQPAEMPAGAIYSLCGAIPDDLLNLLLPDGWAVVRVPSNVDYDEVSSVCRDFISEKDRAHHPESEAGRDIGPTEQATLGAKVVRLRA
jgi:hypothetical protein